MDETFLYLTRQALLLAALVSAPVIGVSLVVGLIVSVLQATTQIQDQTLSYVPKAIAVALALLVVGGWMGSQLVIFTHQVFRSLIAIR